MNRLWIITILSLIMILPQAAMAQERKVTPVESDEEKPVQPTLHYYDKHGNALKEPVLFLAELDTVTKVKSGPVYPLLQSVNVGVNVFDLAMKAFGQKYCSVDVWSNISLFNWFFPTVELGVGLGSNTPEEGNYTYNAKPAFYAKLGFDYNFLYKSNSDYRVFLGFRAGYSSFHYDIKDISISSDYWNQTNRFDLNGQKASAFYGQVLAGVQVKIYKNFSMGWTARYNFKFKVKNAADSAPWFIPGYGTNSPVSATFSLIYNFPIGGRIDKAQEVENN